MKKEDIEHLAKLSRIAVTDSEAESLAESISNILGYVSEINERTGDIQRVPDVGAVYNVLREDGEPHEAGIYTEALLSTAPIRDGQYIVVKKILGDKT
jgi:aspartyl-tRNA(Asn)/glutamyl-tRNA(Gln) amidotransferase subunit C